MPNVNRDQTLYVQTENPDTWTFPPNTTTSLPTPTGNRIQGELGKAHDSNDRTYQRVRLDSGATSATSAGAVAANELAYWKDRANYLVTNDSAQALIGGAANSFRNNVAGIFRSAVPAGYYCDILIRGRDIAVKEAGSATAGMLLISDTSTTAAQALGVAIGNAAVVQLLGVVTTATATGFCKASVDIPNIP